MIKGFLNKVKFDLKSDRLGPDCPFTHWHLHFKSMMLRTCKKRFKSFSNSSQFRAGAYAIACSKITIGKNVVIRPSTMLFADPRKGSSGQIIIENDVMIGSGVHIYVSNHRFDLSNLNIIEQGHYLAETVILKEGCWIGANAIILPGVTIGENSVVGAGSIVTKDVPKRTLIAGNPAKIIRDLL